MLIKAESWCRWSFHFLSVHPIRRRHTPRIFILVRTTDLPMEEDISTRDPSDFKEIQSRFARHFSDPLDVYFHTSPDTFITPRIVLLNFQSTIRIFSSISIFYSFACPLDLVFYMRCTDKKYNDPEIKLNLQNHAH